MKLLVLGGTAGLGRAVTLAAHAAGLTITVLARRAADFGPSATGIRLVIGDVTDAADVERAVAGHDAVVWAVRPVPVRHGADAFEAGIPLVVDAMRRHRVARLVCVSCAAPPRSARERFSPSRLAPRRPASTTAQDLREAPVRTSGLVWTLVRTGTLTNGIATGLYRLLEPEAARGGRVARTDVAAFVVACLADPEQGRRTVLVAG
jgi:uncharacterized protein YbjT (DUF2867 family)